MLKNAATPAPDIRINIDKMSLSVINIFPASGKTTEQEIRQEISARLFQIFKKYT